MSESELGPLFGGSCHAMHRHSVEAYYAQLGEFAERARWIMAWLHVHGPATDREVQAGLGFAERNSVQPRITELVKRGKLEEVSSVKCHITGRQVRMVAVARGDR